MKKISILLSVFVLLTAFTCENEPIEGEFGSDDNTNASCAEAAENTANAIVDFIAATDDNYESLCNAYINALENQIIACGDDNGAIQSLIDSLGNCSADSGPDPCEIATTATQAALDAFNMADESNYSNLCNAYVDALENQITACGDADGNLQSTIDDLGDCVFVDTPPTEFTVFVKHYGHISTTLGWTESTDPNGGQITYSVFVDDNMVSSGLSDLNYYISGLQPMTNYSAVVRASNSSGGFTEANVNFETVPSNIFDGQVILRTQQEVDDFVAEQYTEITNWLIIGREEVTSDITDLGGLQTLVSVTGSLLIGYNFELETLQGLNNISSELNAIAMADNPLLSNIDGLSGIPKIDSYINIVNNDSLTSLDALSNLTHVLTAVNVVIDENDNLIDIDGLLNLDLYVLLVRYNDALDNLDVLSSEDTSLGWVSIRGNPSLTDFSKLSSIQSCSSFDFSEGNATNLDFLSGLTAVNSDLIIALNPNLSDFCGLNALVNAGLNGTYAVSANAYNPTYQDLVDGNCVQ
jgi:hypothetical protein